MSTLPPWLDPKYGSVVALIGNGKTTFLNQLRRDFGLHRLAPDMLEFQTTHLRLKGEVLRQGSGARHAMLVGLVAQRAKSGSMIAFDPFEDQMDPPTIREAIRELRVRAEQSDLAFVLSTTSPVVLNEFQAEPENVILVRHHHPPQPITELWDPDWLVQFALGDLYERDGLDPGILDPVEESR